MDPLTMVIVACVAGEPKCTATHISENGFTSVEACEARIDDVTRGLTKEFGKRPELKGREVTYDASCLDKKQLWQKFGIAQSST